MHQTLQQFISDEYIQKPFTKLTKRERRKLKKQGIFTLDNNGLELRTISPITNNQKKIFELYEQGCNIAVLGSAGTGKTYLAMYLALDEILNQKEYRKLIIFRSAVASRDIGFLPGGKKEKVQSFEAPYIQICTNLFNRGDAYQILKQKNQIEFESTSYLRGLTFDDSVILLEEVQNFNWQELKTVLTRVGKGCRVLMCGDVAQSDLKDRDGKGDINKLIDVCEKMKLPIVEMTTADIVRSGFVKNFILSYQSLGYY